MNQELLEKCKNADLLKEVAKGKEVVWINENLEKTEDAMAKINITMADIDDAEARLARFAPFLMKKFPETIPTNGLIESPLTYIPNMQKKLEEEMAAQGKNYNTNPGGYIWPVDSRYITSTVGGRTSPGGIGSTNHKGTDIGRVGYTSSTPTSPAGRSAWGTWCSRVRSSASPAPRATPRGRTCTLRSRRTVCASIP